MNRQLTRLQARMFARLSRADLIILALIVSLGLLTVALGRRASTVLRPATSIQLSRMVDDLDAPTRLPNAPLVDFSDRRQALFDRIEKPYAVISFYAPWCGPCQKELPELVRTTEGKADLLIVISKDEDLEHTKRQLANLDVGGAVALIDFSGELQREARVTALPTTFVINKHGAVRLRSKGFSHTALWRIESLIEHEGIE